jgi:integrase
MGLSSANARLFERDQFESVRAHLPDWLQGVVTFAYLTGWRIQSEVLPLEWRQVDLIAGVVRLDPGTTKNREGRTFPFRLLPELANVLDRQRQRTTALKGRICKWVFHREGGSLVTDTGHAVNAVRTAWRRASVASGCPGRIPHDFHRTAIRNLVRAGVSEKVAMQLSGHKTRNVFDRYDIVNEHDLAAAVGKLAHGETGLYPAKGSATGSAPGPRPIGRRTTRRNV